MPVSPDLYMSVEQCAEVVHMTPAGFRRLCYEGKIPCSKIGRRYLIRTADFQAWLAEQEQAAEAERRAREERRAAARAEGKDYSWLNESEAHDEADEHERRAAVRSGPVSFRGDAPSMLQARIIG